jgi:hypothetical protein
VHLNIALQTISPCIPADAKRASDADSGCCELSEARNANLEFRWLEKGNSSPLGRFNLPYALCSGKDNQSQTHFFIVLTLMVRRTSCHCSHLATSGIGNFEFTEGHDEEGKWILDIQLQKTSSSSRPRCILEIKMQKTSSHRSPSSSHRSTVANSKKPRTDGGLSLNQKYLLKSPKRRLTHRAMLAESRDRDFVCG